MVNQSNLVDFNVSYNKTMDNWQTVSDEEVDEFKDYIRGLFNIPFETLMVARVSDMVRIIGFCSNGLLNRKMYLVIHVRDGKCKIFEGNCEKMIDNFGEKQWIIFNNDDAQIYEGTGERYTVGIDYNENYVDNY